MADATWNQPRYTAMSGRDALSAEFAELAQAWDVRASHSAAIPSRGSSPRDGSTCPRSRSAQQTAIGGVMDDMLAREVAQRIVAVMLLSDGVQRAFAPARRAAADGGAPTAGDGIPLYTMAFGQPSLGEQNDLRMSDMMASDAVSLKRRRRSRAWWRRRDTPTAR